MIIIVLLILLYIVKRRPITPQKVIPARNFAELPDAESDADRQKRELAAADIERWRAMQGTYRRLLDALETELDGCNDPHRRAVILGKIATTERKAHDLDHKIEKLYHTAHAVK